MQPTIAYREYISYTGTLRLACQLSAASPLLALLPDLLLRINYLGKRGGFFQLLAQPRMSEEAPEGRFVALTATSPQSFEMEGTLQMLDDCGPGLTFAQANTYDSAKIVLHRDRILRHIVLPYRQIRSSRSYSWYQQIER
jgi:hypothetical protein